MHECVTPAKAGVQDPMRWIPASAGMTNGVEARGRRDTMKNICWTLIVVAAVAFAMGTWLAFTKGSFVLEPVGFWRGAIGFLAFAIALRVMDDRKS